MAAAVSFAKKRFGALNVAVSCAGIGIAQMVYNKNKDTAHSLDKFKQVMEVGPHVC